MYYHILLILLSPIVLSYLVINKISQKPIFILLCSLCITIILFIYFKNTSAKLPFINIFFLCIFSTLYLVLSKSFLQIKTVNKEDKKIIVEIEPIINDALFEMGNKNEMSDNNIFEAVPKIEPNHIDISDNIEINDFNNIENNIEKPLIALKNEETVIVVNSPADFFKTEINKPKNAEKNFEKLIKTNEIDNELIRRVGILGEEFVMKYEIDKLKEIGKTHLISKIKHIPTIYGNVNDYGCDIISLNVLEEEIKIEVKTTISGKNTVFYITENEYKYITNSNNYLIYRVYDFDLEKKEGPIIIINTKEDLNKYFKITEAKYVARPRR
jgi:Domain of unknown function (DUF3883)